MDNTQENPRSWKPAVKVAGEAQDKWSYNGLRFATKAEALDNAKDLMGRWMMVTDYDAHPSDDEPNYKWVESRLVLIKPDAE